MAKRVYTDEDKAAVFATLTANGGIVKRTARDTGIPEQTVRDWKKLWERGGLPEKVEAAVPAAIDNFVDQAEKLRDLAMIAAEAKIVSGDVKLGELNALIGTLTDKVRLIQGQATSRKEVAPTITPEQFGQELYGWLERAASAAELRETDIEDAEFVEQAPVALPPAASDDD